MKTRRRTSRTLSTGAGARRAAHFANGGTIQTWRGRSSTFADGRTKATRSRRNAKTKAIRDGW